MTGGDTQSQSSRRRSARISKLQTEDTTPPFTSTSAVISAAATNRPSVNPDFNPYRKQSKEEPQLDSENSPPIFQLEAMSSDDEEGYESITPAAFPHSKGPGHTYVSLSTSTAATTSCINNNNSICFPNSNKAHGITAPATNDSEKHSLRRLLEDDRGRRTSRRTSSRIKQSSETVPAACTSSSISKNKFSKHKIKRHRSSSTNPQESSGGKRFKRKIEGLSTSSSFASTTKGRNKQDSKTEIRSYKAALQELQAFDNDKSKSNKARSKSKTSEKGHASKRLLLDKAIPPIFNYVPDGVFDLDNMHRSALRQNSITDSNDELVDHLTRSKKKRKLKAFNSFGTTLAAKTLPQIKLNIVTTRDANGSFLSNDDDTCFLAQYSLEYYNYLFHKDKENCQDINVPASPALGCKSRLRSATLKLKQLDTKIVAQSPDSTSSMSSESVPKYMKHQINLATFMRGILVDWLIEISDEYKLQAITLHSAVKLVDRALEILVIKRNDLQCLGCACMLMACKLEEITPMTSADYVYVSDKTYTRKEITKMEKDIFNALQFRLYDKATTLHFLHRFLRASDVSFYQQPLDSHTNNREHKISSIKGHASNLTNDVGDMNNVSWGTDPVFQYMTEYLLELALLQPEFVDFRASLVAASALYLARATLGIRDKNGKIWNKTLIFFTTYSADDLKDTVLKLHTVHASLLTDSLSCIAKKYKRKHYYCVALKPGILKEDLGFD